MKTIRGWLAVGAAGAFCVQAAAAPYVILQGNRRVDGITIRARADGSVVMNTATGQVEFPRAQILQAVADRPAEMDRAIRAMQAGQHDEAIPALERIVREMRWLSWDEVAVRPLTQALVAKGNPAAAVAAFEGVLGYRPQLEANPEARDVYYRALLAAGRGNILEPKLDELIRGGSRPEAARALVLRGDLRAAGEQFEAAVLDYLRAVRFYESERALMPEAFLKVARTLEKMRDTRARTWYKRLAEEYPASPEAATARGAL